MPGLLALKIAFLVLLYLFIWRIVASASRDVRPPQESMILIAERAAAPAPRAAAARGRSSSSTAPRSTPGDVLAVDSRRVTFGRGGQNTVALDGDEFASAAARAGRGARGRRLGRGLGSTNGTFVNGARVTTPRQARRATCCAIGKTD